MHYFRMKLHSITITLVLFLIAAIAAPPVRGQVIRDSVKELQGIDVVDHLGDTLPLGLGFVNEDGQPVKLGDYFGRGKPVILILGYYECPMLCNLVFNGVSDAVKELGWVPGDKFQIVTVSINDKETPELAKAKKATYMKSLAMPGAEPGWAFLTGKKPQIDSLAEAVRFKFYFVKSSDEYAHPAVLSVTTEDGVMSRYLFGIAYPKKDLKLALLEAGKGKIGTVIDKIILYCCRYDPDSGSYTVFAQNLMKLSGIVMLFLLGSFIGVLFWRDRRRRHREESSTELGSKSVHSVKSK